MFPCNMCLDMAFLMPGEVRVYLGLVADVWAMTGVRVRAAGDDSALLMAALMGNPANQKRVLDGSLGRPMELVNGRYVDVSRDGDHVMFAVCDARPVSAALHADAPLPLDVLRSILSAADQRRLDELPAESRRAVARRWCCRKDAALRIVGRGTVLNCSTDPSCAERRSPVGFFAVDEQPAQRVVRVHDIATRNQTLTAAIAGAELPGRIALLNFDQGKAMALHPEAEGTPGFSSLNSRQIATASR